MFLLDEHQVVRPGEIGTVEAIEAASARGLRDHTTSLEGQFRCGGGAAYEEWCCNCSAWTAEDRSPGRVTTGFDVLVADSPMEMEAILRLKHDEGLSTRLAAGFSVSVSVHPITLQLMDRGKRLLITDLDNTLWDWFHAWYESFSALLNKLVELSGVPRSQLEEEIRAIHQAHGTSEYSNLVNEIPSLARLAAPEEAAQVYADAIEALRVARRASTKLYADVFDTLYDLKDAGVRLVAYTESAAYWTEWRIKRTGLDGILDVLYTSPDHGRPDGATLEDIRTRPSHYYGLKKTDHRKLERGILKPNADVLRRILAEEHLRADQAVYVGDSLMKDVAMAQEAGVLDVHAKYGVAHERAEYELLRRVTHWTDADVEREKHIKRDVTASFTLEASFGEVRQFFDL